MLYDVQKLILEAPIGKVYSGILVLTIFDWGKIEKAINHILKKEFSNFLNWDDVKSILSVYFNLL